ncbi:MAG: class I tRNA ligase family protein, partial [Patescibacteria group bacterium]
GQSPHRPWLDAVKIKCSKCGALVSRILDVGTPWLDAGIVPFSTISDDNRSENIPYFHNKRKEWEKWFPAELVCEGFPGQFKNWFYVLLVMSQVLEGKPPFKNLLGFANVVDEKGEEMHKSKGNAIWFDEGVEKIGADAMRWMYATQNPANNMRFGYNAAKEVQRKILTLTNCVKFFETYISNEKIKMKNEKPQSKIKNLLDEWIISRLNNLIKTATESLEKFDSTKASLAIEDFWINDLSLWFVRRSRKRFQNPENEQEKQEAEQVLHYTLLTLAKLVAPIMPFLAEEIYQGLKTDNMPESVHLCDWPKADKKAIDEQLEEQMAEARRLVGLALAKRAEAGIGVRQALAKLKIKNEKLKTTIKNEKILELIKEEVNVKEIKFVDGLEGEVELDTMITDELKEEGIARELTRKVNDARKQESFVPGEKKQGIYRSDSDYLNNILAKPEIRTVILNITSTTIMSEQEARDGGAVATGEEKEIKTSEGVVWLRLE